MGEQLPGYLFVFNMLVIGKVTNCTQKAVQYESSHIAPNSGKFTHDSLVAVSEELLNLGNENSLLVRESLAQGLRVEGVHVRGVGGIRVEGVVAQGVAGIYIYICIYYMLAFLLYAVNQPLDPRLLQDKGLVGPRTRGGAQLYRTLTLKAPQPAGDVPALAALGFIVFFFLLPPKKVYSLSLPPPPSWLALPSLLPLSPPSPPLPHYPPCCMPYNYRTT